MSDQMNSEQYRAYVQKQARAKEHNKYHNIPTMSVDGKQMKSVHEATFYNQQFWRMKAGEVKNIEYNVRYELVVNGVYIAAYELDFRITEADGTIRYVDTKSQPTITATYRMKKQLMLALFNIALEEVFAAKEQFDPRQKKGDKK